MRFLFVTFFFLFSVFHQAQASSCINVDHIIAECENTKCTDAFLVKHEFPDRCDSARFITDVDASLLLSFEEQGNFARAGVHGANLIVGPYSSDNKYNIRFINELDFKDITEARKYWEDVLYQEYLDDLFWTGIYGAILFLYFLIIARQFYLRIILKHKGDRRLLCFRMFMLSSV